jgi:putative membrane protein
MFLPWEGFGLTLLFALTGLALMFVGLVVFDILVPFKLLSEVANGNEAVAWMASGFLISTGIVLGDAFRHNTAWLTGVAYSVLGMLLNYLGYYLWEWLTPRWSLNDAMKNGSTAVGKVVFGIFVGLGLIIVGSYT